MITKLRWTQANHIISTTPFRTRIHHNANYNTFYYLSNGSFELPRNFLCASCQRNEEDICCFATVCVCVCVCTFGNYVWLHWNIITLKHWILLPNKRLMSGYINDRNMCADFFFHFFTYCTRTHCMVSSPSPPTPYHHCHHDQQFFYIVKTIQIVILKRI